jgi:glycosyltransferase involved in cell wall biosynthesis
MYDPLVVGVCLTKDRPAMLARAVQSFRAQTYKNRYLLVLDSGAGLHAGRNRVAFEPTEIYSSTKPGASIGELRNLANSLVASADIIVHWDDDDWSHPNRITEQVALLKDSHADVVGYSEMLFWRSRRSLTYMPEGTRPGEAWLYSNKLAKAGSTFCYWRRLWEMKKFADLPRPERGSQGEDHEWASALYMKREPGFRRLDGSGFAEEPKEIIEAEPRMICSIHAANSTRYDPQESPNWKRIPDWDAYCQEKMKL